MIGDTTEQNCYQCQKPTLQVITSVDADEMPATSECTDCGSENDL